MTQRPSATTPRLPDTVVAITGGARGIGRCTAAAFLRAGARVVIGDLDADLCAATARELAAETTGAEGRILGLGLDVTDRASFAAFLDTAEAQVGPIDVLVNNAGIMPTGRFLEESDAMTDAMLDVNVRGVLTGSKLAGQRFTARGQGHLVNIASLAGVNPTAGLATYCGTKSFVLAFTDSLYRELQGSGVRVSAILPGVVRTELSAGSAVPAWSTSLSTVDPEDIAAAVVGVVGSSRLRVTRPRALSASIRFSAMLPTRPRLAFERLTGFDRAFTGADPAARAAYHARIGAAAQRPAAVEVPDRG